MIVMKFGGTSVGSSERIKGVCGLVNERLVQKPIVVVSAMSGVTDKLILAAKEAVNNNHEAFFDELKAKHEETLEQLGLQRGLLERDFSLLHDSLQLVAHSHELTSKGIDLVSSFGEQFSAKMVAACLSKIIPAKPFNAWELGLVTDSHFGGAIPLPESFPAIKSNLGNVKGIPVITGFIAKDKQGNITTLGRGGSDFSAALFGAAVECNEIQIWTDVDGIMTTDPRIVKNARTNPYVSFLEAAEMAYFGAKVLHPATIQPAIEKNIPVRVLNTFNPDGNGTLIMRETGQKKSLKGIAFKRNIIIINITSTRMLNAYGFLAKIFEVFNKHRKSIDLIATTEVSVSVSVDKDDNLEEIMHELKPFGEATVKRDRVSVSIIGDGLQHTEGIAGRIFTCVGNQRANIELITQGSSEINLTFVIEKTFLEGVVQALHREFFE